MKRTIYLFTACCMAMAGSIRAQTIYTLCGGAAGFSGDGGPASAAMINGPAAIKYNAGSVYFVDAANERIRKITGSGYTISTYAGTGVAGFSGDGGPATAAMIKPGGYGGGIATDNNNNLYNVDIYNHRVRKIDASGTISTVGGDGVSGFSGDGGPATAAQFSYPNGIAVDATGNLYVADQSNHRIRKIDAITGIITTVAGTITGGFSGDGSAATAAEISSPSGVAVDASGNLFIADYGNDRIRKVTSSTGIISTFATGIQTPNYMEFDQAGNLFVGTVDAIYSYIYRVSTSGVVTKVAGNATSSASGDGGPATAAGIGTPAGITITPAGDLLITDMSNDRIRIVVAETATISGIASVCVGATTALTASIPGAAWKSGNTTVATVSSTGVVTGVAAGSATITYVAGLVFGTKTITVSAPAMPTITASGATLSVPATYASYQWSLGGTPITGATSATYVATANGTYAVAVTDAGGCSATSANFVLNTLSVADMSKAGGLKVSPNPAVNGQFTVNMPSDVNEKMVITVTNTLGAKVYETMGNSNTPVTIKMNVPAGIYIVYAKMGAQNYHTKIVVE